MTVALAANAATIPSPAPPAPPATRPPVPAAAARTANVLQHRSTPPMTSAAPGATRAPTAPGWDWSAIEPTSPVSPPAPGEGVGQLEAERAVEAQLEAAEPSTLAKAYRWVGSASPAPWSSTAPSPPEAERPPCRPTSARGAAAVSPLALEPPAFEPAVANRTTAAAPAPPPFRPAARMAPGMRPRRVRQGLAWGAQWEVAAPSWCRPPL